MLLYSFQLHLSQMVACRSPHQYGTVSRLNGNNPAVTNNAFVFEGVWGTHSSGKARLLIYVNKGITSEGAYENWQPRPPRTAQHTDIAFPDLFTTLDEAGYLS